MDDERSADTQQPDEEHPRGTLVIMLIYLVIMIGIWGSIYLTLIRRG